MERAQLHPDDRNGLLVIADGLSKLDGVTAVYLATTSHRRYVLFPIIDAALLTKQPQETALARAVRCGGFAGTEDEFRASLGDSDAASLLRLGWVRVWAFADVPEAIGEFAYHPGDIEFYER